MQRIVLQINSPSSEKNDGSFAWCLIENDFERENFSGPWDEFISWYQESYSGTSILVCLFGTEVVYRVVDVPFTNKKQLAKALPFLIEEEVAANIESLHVASRPMMNNKVAVATINKSIIHYWVEEFKENALNVSAMYSLADIVDADEDEMLLIEYGDSILIKAGAECVQCEKENIDFYFDAFSQEEFTQISFICTSENSVLEDFADKQKMEHSADEDIEISKEAYSGDIFELLTSAVFQKSFSAVNLLQGEYIVQVESGGITRFFKPVTLAVCLCLIAQLGLYVTSGLYFHRKAEKNYDKTLFIYNELFSNENVVRDELHNVLDSKLRTITRNVGRSEFSYLFSLSAVSVSQLNKANPGNKKIKIEEFRYQKKSGELKLEVNAETITQLDELTNKFSGEGLYVEIVSANEKDSKINATLLVKSGA